VEYEREIGRLNLKRYVTITGMTEDPFQYYSKLDVFLMTSREDPFPLVNLEAAQCGLPIICFDRSGGSVEFVTSDVGFVVPYADTDAMAEKVMELKNDPGLLKRYSENIRSRSGNYLLEKRAPELYDLIQRFKRP